MGLIVIFNGIGSLRFLLFGRAIVDCFSSFWNIFSPGVLDMSLRLLYLLSCILLN